METNIAFAIDVPPNQYSPKLGKNVKKKNGIEIPCFALLPEVKIMPNKVNAWLSNEFWTRQEH